MRTEVNRFACADGRRLTVFDNGNGFYSFDETIEAIEELPFGTISYDKILFESGLYDSAEAARSEAEARL